MMRTLDVEKDHVGRQGDEEKDKLEVSALASSSFSAACLCRSLVPINVVGVAQRHGAAGGVAANRCARPL